MNMYLLDPYSEKIAREGEIVGEGVEVSEIVAEDLRIPIQL